MKHGPPGRPEDGDVEAQPNGHGGEENGADYVIVEEPERGRSLSPGNATPRPIPSRSPKVPRGSISRSSFSTGRDTSVGGAVTEAEAGTGTGPDPQSYSYSSRLSSRHSSFSRRSRTVSRRLSFYESIDGGMDLEDDEIAGSARQRERTE